MPMETQFVKKMNKTEAGFHLLMLLSMSDNIIRSEEHDVVIDYLNDHFNDNIDLIKEQAFLTVLPPEERENHFVEVAQQFYTISTEDERHTITRFAMDVVMADESMQKNENRLINLLYDTWDLV
jgi:uncharacterized tellurite resistance protein B-like protein